MRKVSLAIMETLKQDARGRILQRGKNQFRVEPQLMSLILDIAIKQKLPVGPMIRRWVSERAALETKRGDCPKSQLDTIEQKIDKLLSRREPRSD